MSDLSKAAAVSSPYDLYSQIETYKQANRNLWSQLYNKYSNLIYESTYEDTNELDSIGLYNAATSEFMRRQYPNTNFSLQVLNLYFLEGVGDTPLRSCDKIRIYNKELNFSEQPGAFNTISHTNNELIVDTISYDLRNSGQASITVRQIQSYKSILQKLIQKI
jgi:hypothetical protein